MPLIDRNVVLVTNYIITIVTNFAITNLHRIYL